MRFRMMLALAVCALSLAACGTTATTTASTAAPTASGTTVGALLVADVWARQAGPMPDAMDDTKPTAGTMGDAKPTAGTMDAAMPTAAANGMAMGEDTGAVGAVYLTIRNSASAPDRLIKASSAIAKNVELHTMSLNDGVMEMRPVEAIDVPASGEVALKPGGFHVMLIGLNKALTPGETFDVTLQFEKAGPVTVQASVRAL
jgi:periplasmic copper chaperone A